MKKDLYFKSIFTFLITLLCHIGFGQETYTYSFNSQIFSSNNQTKSLSGINWTLSNNGSYYGYDGTKGQQVGSGSNPATSMTLTTNDFVDKQIKQIKISTSGASNINAKLRIEIGGNNFGNEINLTTSNAQYEFSGDDSGQIVLKWTQTSSKAIYIKKIEIIYEEEIKVVKPSISVEGTPTGVENTYYNSAEIELATSTPYASIYYTTDGSTPTTSSLQYNAPFSISETKTIKAIAVKDGMVDSEIVSLDVTIETPTINTATIPYQEQFSNTLGIWINKIVSGYTNFSGWGSSIDGVTINGYNQGPTEAYLISPKFINNSDLDLKLTFDYTSQYNGNNLKVLISSDYNGYGDPTVATWSDLSVINSTSMSGSLNQLFDNPGSDFHLALFYKDNSQWKKWNIKNLKLEYDLPPLEIPEAKPATNIEDTSFVANWSPVSEIEKYEVEVYTKTKGFAEDLFFSEYIEGSSNNKYIEIYNGTGNSISLQNYKIELYANGSSTATATYNLISTGLSVLEDSNTLIIRNNQANIHGSIVTYQTTSVMNFNGDDALVLKNGDNIIDIFGVIGNDPGTNWTSNGITTVDKTLVRKSHVKRGVNTNPSNNQFDTLSSEWDMYDIDFIGNLGTHNMILPEVKSFIPGSPFPVDQDNSKEITGVNLEENTYYYVVRSVEGDLKSGDSNEIKVYNRTTWDGTRWDNEEPNENIHAVVKGDLIIGQGSDIINLTARSLKLHETRAILVESGSFIKLKDHLINLSQDPIEFEEGAYLIQENDVTNTGNTKFYRNATFFGYDSKFWSSPVEEQSISGFMPNPSAVYQYNELGRNWLATSDDNFEIGKGYAFQVGRNYPFMGQGDETSFPGLFTGVPNNGVITFQAQKSTNGLGDNGVGNPYGSPISMSAFLNANPSVKTLYFWNEDAHYVPGSNPARYNTQTWHSYNSTGSNMGIQNHIGPGVGFIARVNAPGELIFNNSMRNDVALTYVHNRNYIEKDRFWLSLNSDNNKDNQILIGYVEGATNGIDEKYDAKNISNNNSFILSHSNANAMIIEGRQYPLDINDQIPLYFRAKKSGNYTIKLENKEGIFNSQPIYLIDNELNLSINLNDETEYTFNSEIGNFTDRFEIRYQPKETLSTNDLVDTTDLIVYKNDKLNKVTSKENVVGYKVYDLTGRLISNEKVNQMKDFVLATQNKGTYIVKFTLEDGRVISKKVIF